MPGLKEHLAAAAQWAKKAFILDSPVMIAARGERQALNAAESAVNAYRTYDKVKQGLGRFLPWGLAAAAIGGLIVTFKNILFGKTEPVPDAPPIENITATVDEQPEMPLPVVPGQWVSRVEKKAPPASFAARESASASYAASEDLRRQESAGQGLGT